ncbi:MULTISPECIES: DUF1643 domain-containing protein [Bacillaceae]|uniref:DUF1643 domain-containing protein n=1 Tax=Evansella alkalicola TaxID=745819 RepID=A0ABS6JNY5_9BACI|nr:MULTISPECIES: DUF1643 domain-containing protein [Bacillaceae]MBU9720268.1 DUF1643 domain-containing protein [Bacillus alkalicola]
MSSNHRYWSNDEKVQVVFDGEEKKYRYWLECIWNDNLAKVTLIMQNPSRANEKICDQTMTRCINYAEKWGYGGIIVVNLFALIATDPSELKYSNDPIGKDNDFYIKKAADESEKVIFAWGEKFGNFRGRSDQIKAIFSGEEVYCIRKTKKGNHPRHPLYLKKDLTPIAY